MQATVQSASAYQTSNSPYRFIKESINQCDAVLIGASNGLSISEGYNIFSPKGFFADHFADFQKKYGIHSVLDGYFYPFPSEEEKWGFWSRLVSLKCCTDPPTQMMLNLYDLVKDKDYFVMTSNGEDHFIPAGFDPLKVFEMEGKISECRCQRGCSHDIYSNKEDVMRMIPHEKNGKIPAEFIPKCPKCGANLDINIATNQSFFSTPYFREKHAVLENFLKKYHGKKLVVLEFGVGWRNTMIKRPMMDLVSKEPNAVYITFNKGEVYIPKDIAPKSIGINEDISIALQQIINE